MSMQTHLRQIHIWTHLEVNVENARNVLKIHTSYKTKLPRLIT